MNKYHTTFLFTSVMTSLGFGSTTSDSTTSEQPQFIDVYILSSGGLYLNGKSSSIKSFNKYLDSIELRQARVATLFPTPMEAFATIDKVTALFTAKNIVFKFYKDRHYTKPAFQD